MSKVQKENRCKTILIDIAMNRPCNDDKSTDNESQPQAPCSSLMI
jgi:hypothetical protein